MNAGAATTSTGLTALIVDDEAANLGILVDVLSRAGFRVLVAEDGEAAIDICGRVVADVVFLDVGLPGIDGFATCRKLRALRPTLPILFLTAHDQTADRVRGYAAGGDDWITKPFRAEELLARGRAYATASALRRRVAQAAALLEKGDVDGARAVLQA